MRVRSLVVDGGRRRASLPNTLPANTKVELWQPTTAGAATGVQLPSRVIPGGTAVANGGFAWMPVTPYSVDAHKTFRLTPRASLRIRADCARPRGDPPA